jgi:hypothetical protein
VHKQPKYKFSYKISLLFIIYDVMNDCRKVFFKVIRRPFILNCPQLSEKHESNDQLMKRKELLMIRYNS